MKRLTLNWLVPAVMATAVVFAVIAVLLSTPLPSRASGVQRVILPSTDCGCQQQVQYVRQVREVRYQPIEYVQEDCEPIYTIQQRRDYVRQIRQRQSQCNQQPIRLQQRQRDYDVQPVVFRQRQRVVDYGGGLNINLGHRRSEVRVGGLRLRVR